MKDYARNNFRQYQEDNLKTKTKKKSKTYKLFLIYGVAAIIGIIILLGMFSFFSSKKSSSTSEQDTKTKIIAPKTPEIFEPSSPKPEPSPADQIIIETENNTNKSSEVTPENNVTTSLNSSDMQQIANEKLSQDETALPVKEDNKNDNSPKFTFYNDLSNQEVASDATAKKAKQYIYTYMLQVGSYRDKEAVDAMRARLILIGLTPDVSKHGSWYRIDVGPVHSKREGDILKHKLEAAKISGSMLRQISKKEVIEEPEGTTPENKAN